MYNQEKKGSGIVVNIYIVRHCEAQGNKLKLFQGSTDCDITEKGAEQLRCLSKRFHDIHIDKAYSSTLLRAKKTALAAIESKGIEVETNKDFNEMNGGFLEGMSFEKIFSDYAPLEHDWNYNPHKFAPENAESMQQVYTRATNALKAVASDPENDGKTILIATHGVVTRCIMCFVSYGQIERLVDTPWSSNTAVSLITYDKGTFSIEFAGDMSHLPENLLPSPQKHLRSNNP